MSVRGCPPGSTCRPKALDQFASAEALEQCVDQHQVECAQPEKLKRLQGAGDNRCPEPGDRQAGLQELAADPGRLTQSGCGVGGNQSFEARPAPRKCIS